MAMTAGYDGFVIACFFVLYYKIFIIPGICSLP